MFRSFLNLHRRRPILWTVIAFVTVLVTAAIMSVWWNVLLVQNHRILRSMTDAARAAQLDPTKANLPLGFLMLFGLLCSLVIVTGLLYMFLRLIRAVQLNLAQSQFIAAVTHELRSPVAGLQLMLDTIRDPSTPTDKRREFEECMHSDLQRLQELVDQVLDTARLEHYISKVPAEQITLEPFLKHCCQLTETRLKTTSSTLSFPKISPTLSIKANRRLLTAVVSSLIDNAVKYSSGPAELTLNIETKPKTVVIEIQDRGIGISPKEQKRVFKRFYRAGDPLIEARSGAGLGLYFARLAIRAQGGTISVHSKGMGLGSSFKIEVPQ